MENPLQGKIASIRKEITGLSIENTLSKLTNFFPGKVVFSTSFSLEDQVITNLIQSLKLDIKIFSLDTGRLFQQTYSTWSRTNLHFNTKISAYSPKAEALEVLVNTKGPNSFYESVNDRKQCCYIRKVEPLKRALAEKAVWIAGLRAEHSSERQGLEILEWDFGNSIIKYNPLLSWTSDEVREYIRSKGIPYNPLQDQGFVSIGCQPCTRAVKEGEEFRAGRWWWEDNSKKECGLHLK
jgi:phosphoadenosine phosphosulfate reductase